MTRPDAFHAALEAAAWDYIVEEGDREMLDHNVTETERYEREREEPMSEHTPGPWKIGGRLPYSRNAMVTGQRGGNPASIIAQVYIDERGTSRAEEQEANARLISSAPLLLEALEVIVYQMTANRPPSECMALALEAARAALAAATGEEGEVAFPATAEGELQRQAAFAAERARQEEDRDRCGDPPL